MIFFKYKPYDCVKSTKKEKLSCLCINCLNPHLFLQSINIYRKSKGLPSHNSLTEYIDRLNKAEKFQEANDDKACKFYSYQRVVEGYIKQGKPIEYQRTARVDDTRNLIKDWGSEYKKHRSYVDNCLTFFSNDENCQQQKIHWAGLFRKSNHPAKGRVSVCPFFQ